MFNQSGKMAVAKNFGGGSAFRWSFVLGIFLILFALASCAPQRGEPLQRHFITEISLEETKKSPPPLSDHQVLMEFLNEGKQYACGWLESLEKPNSRSGVFQMSRVLSVSSHSGGLNNKAVAQDLCFFECLPINIGTDRCQSCMAKPKPAFLVRGSIDPTTNPLYQAAILENESEIPNRQEFLKLIDDETKKVSFLEFPFYKLYKIFAEMGVGDLYKKRNEIIEQVFHKAFPGAFDAGDTHYVFNESFPFAVLKNGMNNAETLIPYVTDSSSVKNKKLSRIRRIMKIYSTPTAFMPASWREFEKQSIYGVNAALKSLQSGRLEEQACASLILHRVFGQMYRSIGYDSLPVSKGHKGKKYFTELSSILNSSQGTKFRVCPSPGYLAHPDGELIRFTPKSFAEYGSEDPPLLLEKNIAQRPDCHWKNSVTKNSSSYKNYRQGNLKREGDLSDWLSLVQGAAHLITALNPGAIWWHSNNKISFPLVGFRGVDQIAASGGHLPYEAHALPLGLINLAINKVEQDHLVIIDDQYQEVMNMDDVPEGRSIIGIRLSQHAREKGGGEVITSRIEPVVQVAELALRMYSYLPTLKSWHRLARSRRYQDLKVQYNNLKRDQIRFSYNEMIEGMFGNQTNLNDLIETGDDSTMDLIEDIRLAASMLVLHFAKRTEDGDWTCFERSELDLGAEPHLTADSPEERSGECSPEMRER